MYDSMLNNAANPSQNQGNHSGCNPLIVRAGQRRQQCGYLQISHVVGYRKGQVFHIMCRTSPLNCCPAVPLNSCISQQSSWSISPYHITRTGPPLQVSMTIHAISHVFVITIPLTQPCQLLTNNHTHTSVHHDNGSVGLLRPTLTMPRTHQPSCS